MLQWKAAELPLPSNAFSLLQRVQSITNAYRGCSPFYLHQVVHGASPKYAVFEVMNELSNRPAVKNNSHIQEVHVELHSSVLLTQ